MRHGVILSEAYSTRIKAIEALRAATEIRVNNAQAMRNAADDLDADSISCDYSVAAASYGALAGLLRVTAMLVEWRGAILEAEQDADRFLRSAKAQYKLWLDEYSTAEIQHGLLEGSSAIESVTELDLVGNVCHAIASIPLPIPFFAAAVQLSRIPRGDQKPKNEPPVELQVAFLQFEINGEPAKQVHFLTPQMAHDLEIEVRVTRWPDNATTLDLRPVTIEQPDSYDFPHFRFNCPSGDGPFVMKQRGRAILKFPHSIQASPFEFKYAAEFSPRTSEQPVAVVGQRTLRIEGFDLQRSPITG